MRAYTCVGHNTTVQNTLKVSNHKSTKLTVFQHAHISTTTTTTELLPQSQQNYKKLSVQVRVTETAISKRNLMQHYTAFHSQNH